MPTTSTIATTDEGRLSLKGNELLLEDTTGGDPVAVRWRSANGGVGKLSADVPDGAGGWTEIGYLFIKRDERPGKAHWPIFEFWKSGSTDADAARLFEIRADAIIAHVPIAQPGGAAAPSRFVSDDGRYVYNVQGDPTLEYPSGRIVQYRASDMQPVAILRPEPL